MGLWVPGASYAAPQGGAYLENGGLVVTELEATNASGYWQRDDSVAGSTGEGYLSWAGSDSSSQAGISAFAVELLIQRAGRYQLRVRNHHDNSAQRFGWVRIDGGQWQRIVSSQSGQWTWSTRFVLPNGKTPKASVSFDAGRHLLELSAGSTGLRQDRVHLFMPALVDGEDNSLPVSDREFDNSPPVASFTIDPPNLPSTDNGATVLTLDASSSFDPDPGQALDFRWRLRGALYVQGTTAKSQVAKVRLVRSGIAHGVHLRVRDDNTPQRQTTTAHSVIGVTDGEAEAYGPAAAWQPLELWFHGPLTYEDAADPNPFMDYRLDVTFTGPWGSSQTVPGFYAGDGNGGGVGDVWKARFAAPQGGLYSWSASFREGPGVAVGHDPLAGQPGSFDGASGDVFIRPPDPAAPGFWGKGRLEYVGQHYLRFSGGEYFLKGGTDSPENLLGYDGFDDVQDVGGKGIVHRYSAHEQHWRDGDPLFHSASSGVSAKGIIGGLNYLSTQGVNSVYFLPMNLGGDGQETYPFIDPTPNGHNRTHYDVSRMHQWAQVLDHAQRRGVLLHVVLAETEHANENWLDNGALGPERKLFFRELIARFGHAPALKWNLSEENDYSISELDAFADRIHSLDGYGHALGVHTHPNDFSDYPQLLGKPQYTSTSIQYSPSSAGAFVEEWRSRSALAGRKWVLDMDENTPAGTGLNSDNADELRKETLYDVYFSGGQIEWYAGYHGLPLGGDVKLEDFRTRAQMWRYMRIARAFMLEHLPFWEMEPRDDLVTGEKSDHGGAEVLAKVGEVYAVYLPRGGGNPILNLGGQSGLFRGRWYDPRVGAFVGKRSLYPGGTNASLGSPPRHPDQDWIQLIDKLR